MREYKPLSGRRRAVLVTFGALIVLDLLAIGSTALELDLVDRIEAGEPIGGDAIKHNDTRQRSVGAMQVLLMGACAVVFIRWLYAAYRNADHVAPGVRRYHRGWAIGGWFVPILYLWRPKQIVNDAWRAGGSRALSPLLAVWWGAWLIDLFVWGFGGRRSLYYDTIDNGRSQDLFFMASDAFDAAVAALAVLVVWRITERLDGRAAALSAAPAPTT